MLAWIESLSRSFKPFVLVRVGEIQIKSDPSQFVHITGEHNVAHDVSRGIHARELKGHWLYCPEFLYSSKNQWATTLSTLPPTADLEQRQFVAAVTQ